MMRRTIILFALVYLFTNLYAQSYDYLDFNQIKARVNSNGALFHDEIFYNLPSFEVPQGMGTHTIFIANLWVAGIDENGELHAVGPQFNQSPENYFGPVADNYVSAEFRSNYDKVWKVDIDQILSHIDNFNKPGYEMPESFKTWPAEGNTENGEAANLAPYYDYNENGIYDPHNGDFPLIKGDHAVYFIYNDAQGHSETDGEIMELEFHGILYGFNSTVGSVFTETVFLNYQIINRSEHDYTNVYAGLWTDFEIGFAIDDVFGSDSINQMMYVYNASNEDGIGYEEEYYSDFYDSPPPVQGVMLLNPEIYAATEVWKFSNVLTFLDYSDIVVNNFLQGKDPSGFPFHYNDEVTTYYQSGYPELEVGWIPDTSLNYIGRDVRGLISAGPYTLNSGEKVCLDFALPYARDLQGDNLSALSVLREKAGAILDFFEENDLGCDSYQTGIINRISNQDEINVYPNPSNGEFSIDLSGIQNEIKNIEVYSYDGSLIDRFSPTSNIISIKIEVSGIYFIKVDVKGGIITKRIVIL